MNKQNLLILGVALTSLLVGGAVYQYNKVDFMSIQGERFKWTQMQEKTLVVNYFAEWCAPCLKEIPELNAFEIWSQDHTDIEFIAVSYDPLNAQKLTEIVRKYNMQFPVIANTGDNFPLQLPEYLPATFILKSGNVSQPLLGEQTVESLIRAVQATP